MLRFRHYQPGPVARTAESLGIGRRKVRSRLSWLAKGATIAACGALLSQPASATYWRSATSQLNVYEGGAVQGQAYGNYYNKGGTHAASQSYRRDAKPGGDGVFVHVTHHFLDPGHGQWIIQGADRTNNTTSGSWLDSTYTAPLSRYSDTARGIVHVCEDHSFAGDPCSVDVIVSFSY
jgi:hypothetical protein